MDGDADIASIASVIGHPARGRMLTALYRGPAMSASELAAEADVSASTASAHLARLTESGLVVAERSGPRRLHRGRADPPRAPQRVGAEAYMRAGAAARASASSSSAGASGWRHGSRS